MNVTSPRPCAPCRSRRSGPRPATTCRLMSRPAGRGLDPGRTPLGPCACRAVSRTTARCARQVRRGDDPQGTVERGVVLEVNGAELRVAERVALVGEPDCRLLRGGRLHQDPAVALYLYRAPAHTELVEQLEEVSDLCGDEQPVAATEASNALARAAQLPGALLQVVIDFGNRRGELIGVGGEQVLDAGQGHSGLGKSLDL